VLKYRQTDPASAKNACLNLFQRILNNSPANMAIFFALEQGLLSCG